MDRGATGTARVPVDTPAQHLRIRCGNCHGGSPVQKSGVTYPLGTPARRASVASGRITGRRQVAGIQTSTGTARPAYRFTNGNSMRFYNPGGWASTAARTCYTLGNAADPGRRPTTGVGARSTPAAATGGGNGPATATGAPGSGR